MFRAMVERVRVDAGGRAPIFEMRQDLNADREAWAAAEIGRCRNALAGASALADRLALLRSLARLQHGRLELAAEGVCLSQPESNSLARFGLAESLGTLRIVDETAAAVPASFWEAERLDTASRRVQDSASADAVLLRHTSHTRYSTTAQKAGVRAVLTMPDGASLMVSMPTGSGKSLLFQLEALRKREEEPGACIAVITPTVSLALDHARTLAGIRGLEGSRVLTGDMGAAERADVLDSFRRGEVPILLLSPESAMGAARSALVEAATPPGAKFQGLDGHMHMFVVDEAHIVESWGRSFRPDFQRLPALIEELRENAPGLKVLLLSATLPPSARSVLRNAYASEGAWLEVNARTPRYEFDLVVQSYDNLEDRLSALDFVIDRAPRPLIVYTTLVDEVDATDGRELRLSAEQVFHRLKARKYDRIGLFTGDIRDSGDRNRILRDWVDDRVDIIVATSAFGMGVDKSNVRTVLHACLPEGPARWYQEIGRASRDGHQGLGICLFSDGGGKRARTDVDLAFSQATGSWLTRELAEERWLAMLERGKVEWRGGAQRISLSLSARHRGLKGPRSGKQNRVWNMSLLNLMQRASVLQVVAVDGESDRADPTWTVEIKDPEVLNLRSATAWDRVFAVRDAEQQSARSELNRFLNVMRRPATECLLREVFEQIDDESLRHVPTCGRCPSCRARGADVPSEVASEGLEKVWNGSASASAPVRFVSGATIVAPDDPTFETGLDALVRRLAQVGIEQFCVPNRWAASVADFLVHTEARLGLVLSHREFLENQPATRLPELQVALLLPQEDQLASLLLSRAAKWAEGPGDRSLVIVGDPHRVVDGRRLDQSASRLAPFPEALLEAL